MDWKGDEQNLANKGQKKSDLPKLRKPVSHMELTNMAKEYHVADNPMFVSASERYAQLNDLLRATYDQLGNEMLVSKEYIKGRESVVVNPLVIQIPKFIDGLNRTQTVMLSIIEQFGWKEEKKTSRFGDIDDE